MSRIFLSAVFLLVATQAAHASFFGPFPEESVPEPTTLGLIATGVGAIAVRYLYKRRRKK